LPKNKRYEENASLAPVDLPFRSFSEGGLFRVVGCFMRSPSLFDYSCEDRIAKLKYLTTSLPLEAPPFGAKWGKCICPGIWALAPI